RRDGTRARLGARAGRGLVLRRASAVAGAARGARAAARRGAGGGRGGRARARGAAAAWVGDGDERVWGRTRGWVRTRQDGRFRLVVAPGKPLAVRAECVG